MHHPRIDPSPTALRSPLSPWRGIKIKIAALSLGERGDRKAVGEGYFSSPSDFDGTLPRHPAECSMWCDQAISRTSGASFGFCP